MPNYDEIIKQSQANVKSLSEKLNDLDKLYLEIKALKEAAEGIPVIFDNKFQEIVKLSETYTNTLGVSTKVIWMEITRCFPRNLTSFQPK